jgi:hypothetical protein
LLGGLSRYCFEGGHKATVGGIERAIGRGGGQRGNKSGTDVFLSLWVGAMDMYLCAKAELGIFETKVSMIL